MKNYNRDQENLEWTQRVESLCSKIGNIREVDLTNTDSDDKLVGIRIRSAKNLLFKISVLKKIPEETNEVYLFVIISNYNK